MVNFKKIRI